MRRDKMEINKDWLLEKAMKHIYAFEERSFEMIEVLESWGLSGSEIYELWEEYVDENDTPFRVCTICGRVMDDGYYDGDYFCSNECLHTKYTDEEWEQACEEDDDCYWTHWY